MVKIPTDHLSSPEKINLYDEIWKYLDENLAECSDYSKMQATSPCCMHSIYRQGNDVEFWMVHFMDGNIGFWTTPEAFQSMILLKFGGKNG